MTVPDFVTPGESLTRSLPGIVRDLQCGGLLVMPTDTVYGIASAPFVPGAVASLQAVKGRGDNYPPPVLLDDAGRLEEYCRPDAPTQLAGAKRLAESFWPGALTIIIPVRDDLGWIPGQTGGTMALRLANHAVSSEILAATGPLAVSSANRHGEAPAVECAQAHDYFHRDVNWYVDGGRAISGLSSTIVDLRDYRGNANLHLAKINENDGGARIVRIGDISAHDIGEVLAG